MAFINYDDIKDYLTDNSFIESGKEASAYRLGNQVIKIFHDKRKSSLDRISDQGLIELCNLKLNTFNTPNNLIINNGICGTCEDMIIEEDLDKDKIPFSKIKEDLITLSENGFTIDDLYYNYMGSNDGIKFYDLTSYKYIKTDNEFIKNKILKDNIRTMNIFLAGLLNFGAFQKGSTNEKLKIYQAYEFQKEYCGDEFYGDIFGNEIKK